MISNVLHAFRNINIGLGRITSSYLSVHEAVEHRHHKTLRDVKTERPVLFVVNLSLLKLHLCCTYKTFTCVDDRASSAKFHILNIELLNLTGRKANRM